MFISRIYLGWDGLDEEEDLKVIKNIGKNLNRTFTSGGIKLKSCKEVIQRAFNSFIKRNEGARMSKTTKLWKGQNKLFQVGICYYPKDLKFSSIIWPPISRKPKIVLYGI